MQGTGVCRYFKFDLAAEVNDLRAIVIGLSFRVVNELALDRVMCRQRPQEIAEILDERMKLEKRGDRGK